MASTFEDLSGFGTWFLWGVEKAGTASQHQDGAVRVALIQVVDEFARSLPVPLEEVVVQRNRQIESGGVREISCLLRGHVADDAALSADVVPPVDDHQAHRDAVALEELEQARIDHRIAGVVDADALRVEDVSQEPVAQTRFLF